MFGTTLGGTILDDQVPTLDIPKFAQCLSECFKICGVQGQRCCFQHADAPHPLALLRARRERPRRRRAAEQRDELASLHYSITSSARASSVGGTSRPSTCAVCRLMTSSNLVGRATGSSPGFSPLRTLPA